MDVQQALTTLCGISERYRSPDGHNLNQFVLFSLSSISWCAVLFIFIFFLVCVRIHLCHMFMETRDQLWYHSSKAVWCVCVYMFERAILFGVHWRGYVGCLVRPNSPPVCASPALVLQAHGTAFIFPMGSGDLNSGPHAFKASTLPTELPLQPSVSCASIIMYIHSLFL